MSIHTRFSRGFTAFSRKNYHFFPLTLQSTQEYSKSFPIRRLEPRTENYPILLTFLFFLSYGDLAALELRKAEKTCLQGALQFIPYFPAKFYHNFPQNVKQAGKAGIKTCDFLAEVEGQSLPPPRPKERCDELRLVEGLVVCRERSQGTSFCVLC